MNAITQTIAISAELICILSLLALIALIAA